MEPLAIVLTIVILTFVAWALMRSRARQKRLIEESATTAAAAGLSTMGTMFESGTGHHAPVAEFHVRGDEIQVTFDVPLPDHDDPVLDDLLVNEAVEVVREKRHSLPIEQARVIVALAGRGDVREVGRTVLPEPGQLPPQSEDVTLTLANIAHDPFAAPFDEDSVPPASYDARADTGHDLVPLGQELKIPQGLDRGLRALGVDPASADGAELIVSLLRMFGYTVSEQAFPGSYVAVKDGTSTYILTDPYEKGGSTEVEDSTARRFLADFASSGADRGMLLSEKYAPFSMHEIEGRQPKVRFVTRERVQRFVDSMALG